MQEVTGEERNLWYEGFWEGMDCISVVRDKNMWQAVVITLMHLQDKVWGISWLLEELLASQAGLFPMELVSQFVSQEISGFHHVVLEVFAPLGCYAVLVRHFGADSLSCLQGSSSSSWTAWPLKLAERRVYFSCGITLKCAMRDIFKLKNTLAKSVCCVAECTLCSLLSQKIHFIFSYLSCIFMHFTYNVFCIVFKIFSPKYIHKYVKQWGSHYFEQLISSTLLVVLSLK